MALTSGEMSQGTGSTGAKTKSRFSNFVELGSFLKGLWLRRDLILEMSRRDIGQQYAGQILGGFWSIVHPIFLAAIYVFLFAVVFRTKINQDMPFNYTVYLLSGLVPWMGIQQTLTRSSVAFTSQANLVKQVVFPIEVLVANSVFVPMFSQFVGIVFVFAYVLLSYGTLPATFLLLPLAIIFQIAFLFGLGLILASLTSFIRDVKDIVVLMSVAGVYLVPAFYLPQWVPRLFKPLLYVNPLSYLIWIFQDCLYFGTLAHWWAWLAMAVLASSTLWVGFALFRRLQPHIANAL
jgi:lipopolysaccharide transport system permease protein